MDYRFREIRKHECAAVLDFAKTQGCNVEPAQLRHHLGLTVKSAGELIAVAMCVEYEPRHYKIEIVHGKEFINTQITDLADRCLRKVQSAGIASARLRRQSEEATRELFKQASWLDHIQETGPPDNHQPYIPETRSENAPEPVVDDVVSATVENDLVSPIAEKQAADQADDPMAKLAAQIANLTAAPEPTTDEEPEPATDETPATGMSEAEIEAAMLAEMAGLAE